MCLFHTCDVSKEYVNKAKVQNSLRSETLIKIIASSLLRQEISDELMQSLTDLIASPIPSETDSAWCRSYITYTLPLSKLKCTSCLGSASFEEVGAHNRREIDKEREQSYLAAERSIMLLESHSVISVAGNTGQRTWEAALHLAAYLVSEEVTGSKVSKSTNVVSEHIRGKHIVELGAGTGLVSMLCIKYLGARRVLVTDGDEDVVDALETNIILNRIDETGEVGKTKTGKSVTRKIQASVLRWGYLLSGTSLGELFDDDPPDTVVAADVVSEPFSVSLNLFMLRLLFSTWYLHDY